MVKLKLDEFYIDEKGNIHKDLERHYAIDEETGDKYTVIQVDTGIEYYDAVDLKPCLHVYAIGNKIDESIKDMINNE